MAESSRKRPDNAPTNIPITQAAQELTCKLHYEWKWGQGDRGEDPNVTRLELEIAQTCHWPICAFKCPCSNSAEDKMFLDNPIPNQTSTICHPWAIISLSSSFIGPRKPSIPTAAVSSPLCGWILSLCQLSRLGSFLSPNRISQRAQREFSKPPHSMPTHSQTPCGHGHTEGGKQSRCQAHSTPRTQINTGISSQSSRQKNPSRKCISFEIQIITHATKL